MVSTLLRTAIIRLKNKYNNIKMEVIKVCTKCEMEKSLIKFCKDKRNKSGYGAICKDCAYKYNAVYTKARRLYDSEFKLLTNMRSRLGQILKGTSKSQTTQQLIGVNFEIFTKWIQFQFEEGMTMNNYGSAWCHDHVLPISSFNLLEEGELQKAMNWKNIRPMQPLKNIKKSNKIDRWLYVMQEVKAHYFIKHFEEL